MSTYWITAADNASRVIYNKRVTAPSLELALKNVKDQVPVEHHGSICVTDEHNNPVEGVEALLAPVLQLATTPKSRDTLITETTQRLLGDWAAELQAGDQRAISDLHNTVLDRLSGEECKALFIQAATDKAGANAGFTALVGQTMTDVCAADAERIADILLGQLVDNANDARTDRAVEARAAA